MHAKVFFIASLIASGASASAILSRQNLPACASTCLSNTPTGSCGSTDFACLCKDPDYVSAVTGCLLQQCTNPNDLQAAEAAASQICQAAGVPINVSSIASVATASLSSAASAQSVSQSLATSASAASASIVSVTSTLVAGAVSSAQAITASVASSVSTHSTAAAASATQTNAASTAGMETGAMIGGFFAAVAAFIL